ncbi:MAG: DUF3048 domain-containing protein [Clostridiales bacterium]|nr:DUF3048 domain-containing protein [Clostridiales bacterium]
MKIKKTILLVACIAILAVSSACSKDDNNSKKVAATTSAQTTTVATLPLQTNAPKVTENEDEPEPEGIYNNLSGLYNLSEQGEGKRPVAVMVNNIKASLPQYGTYGADIMFECPVEGGITRLMAIYADYSTVPNICSTRSCRYYYPIFAQGYDAIYFHHGYEAESANTLKSIDHFDGLYNGTLFQRDKTRVNYAMEHTSFLKGSAIVSEINRVGMRSNLSDSYNSPVFNFVKKADVVSETKCTQATIKFSNAYYSTFTYDEGTKTYKKQHSGQPHMDTAVNKQLEYTNVFYLETTTSVFNQSKGYMDLDWKGGNGYYISNGTIIAIKWSKPTEKSQIKLTTNDGEELKVNPGNSYMGFSNKNTLSY